MTIDGIGNGQQPQQVQKQSKISKYQLMTNEEIVISNGRDSFAGGGLYNQLEQCINFSILGNTQLKDSALLAKGFEKSSFMDMNGGEYYHNSITDERLRINHSWGDSGSVCYEFKKGNMQHSVIYDKNGRAVGGDVQIKQKDGTLKIIKYDIDYNGNKIIRSSDVMICENQSGFFNHDGKF